jgi:hypothetical protein
LSGLVKLRATVDKRHGMTNVSTMNTVDLRKALSARVTPAAPQ